jgi:hypothetical protein
MTRLPDISYVPVYSYTYVPFRWKGNKLSFREGLSDTQVPWLSLAFVEQRRTAKFGGGLRNVQRNKRLPIKRSSSIRVLFTDRGEIEGSKLAITLREDSDYKRRPRSESVQAPLCMTLFVIPGGSQEDASVLAGSRYMPGRDSLERRQPAAGGRVMGAVKHNVTFVSNPQVVT